MRGVPAQVQRLHAAAGAEVERPADRRADRELGERGRGAADAEDVVARAAARDAVEACAEVGGDPPRSARRPRRTAGRRPARGPCRRPAVQQAAGDQRASSGSAAAAAAASATGSCSRNSRTSVSGRRASRRTAARAGTVSPRVSAAWADRAEQLEHAVGGVARAVEGLAAGAVRRPVRSDGTSAADGAASPARRAVRTAGLVAHCWAQTVRRPVAVGAGGCGVTSSWMTEPRRLEITTATDDDRDRHERDAGCAACRWRPRRCDSWTTAGAMSSATRFITLISGLMAGPAVSLNGSPTVSPMTVAAWRLGALAAVVAVLDELLGVVPRATGVGEEHGHQRAGGDRTAEVAGERADAEAEADGDRRQGGEQARGRELAQRVAGADVDDPAVLRLLGAVHDPGVLAELAAHLEDDRARRPARPR